MSGPWEKYGSQEQHAKGPWERYQAAETPVAAEEERGGNRYVGAFKDGIDALADGMTFGVAPYIRGVARGALTDETMGEGIATEKADQARRREERPASTFINEAGGGLLTGGGLVNSGISATRMLPARANLAQRSTAIGADAAVMGGISAAAEGQDIGQGALTGFALGAGGNAALEKGADAISGVLRRRQLSKAARPHAASAEVDDAYNAFRGQNVAYTPEWARQTAAQYEGALQKQALSKRMAPQAHAAYDDLMDVANGGDAVSAEWVENLRRVLSKASTNKANPQEAHASGVGSGILGDALRNARQSDVAAGGSAKVASESLDLGREAFKRSLKADEIRKVMESAQGGYASGDSNAMRLGLRGIIRKAARDKQFGKLWSKDELEAIKNAADGGPIDNLLRQFGKMGFAGTGQGSSGLGGMMGLGAGGGMGAALGGMVGGPIGAAAGGALGGAVNSTLATGARRAADAGMSNRMKLVNALITNQGKMPSPTGAQQFLTDENIRALLADALAGGATAGP